VLGTIDVVIDPDDASGSLTACVRSAAERLVPGLRVGIVSSAGERSSVRINGRPIAGGALDPPPEWAIEAAIAHALEPRNILFMCVANSARSQMAEAMARSLARDGVTIASAGSSPTVVRPEAIAVLAEIGVDAGGLRSKGVSEIDVDGVQLLITLCADEVCPTVLRPVPRLHWPVPDPATVTGDGDERLLAFRRARDTIRERLHILFRG